jgi:basic membrane lipoprotein Med (substrate-binding protein (PBP1-ABC) superfamily)
VAPEFPNTKFVVVSDLSTTKGLKNVSGWAVNWNQLGYLAGTAGCLGAKANGASTVGHVNSQPIPAFARFAAGDQDGAAAAGCKFLTRWTNSFSDTAKAKQAALSMIAQGAGTITTTADTADEGSRAGAAQAKKLFIANYAPAIKEAPSITLTSMVINFDQVYDQVGKVATTSGLGAHIYPVTVENGGLTYETPFKNAPTSVEKQSQATYDKIKSGAVKVDATKTLKP